jgi:hypothetical protein
MQRLVVMLGGGVKNAGALTGSYAIMPTRGLMLTAKQQIQKVLEHLPEDCTLEDVQYQLYVLEKLRRRVAMADQGTDFVPQTEVEERMKKWLIK